MALRTSESSVKTHWLYGHGLDKILDFKREVDEETDCSACVHREVCGRDVEKRCENYQYGTSERSACQGCSHRFTRYDEKSVPCFSCPWFRKSPSVEEIALAAQVAAETGPADSVGALARSLARTLIAAAHPQGKQS